MTEQERQRAITQGIELLMQQYGYRLEAQIVPRQYGNMIQVEAQLALVPIQDWQPPQQESKERQIKE